MVTREQLEERRGLLTEGDLAALFGRLTGQAESLLERPIIVPEMKAELSTRGGRCEQCGAPLRFDPWSPERHGCPSCGATMTGPHHQRSWARPQHLWVAERAAQLAVVGVLGDDERFAGRAREILAKYGTLYPALPNRDNVLGPSHLFFSTYLESIWVLNYLAAAQVLREQGWLSDSLIEGVNRVADLAANLIGEFNEGHSNRQTWNSAALTAIGVWFGDEELIRSSIEERTGLIGHLTDGFGEDGMWFEGENYHLFALRGLLTGIQWASAAGAAMLEDPELAGQLNRALMAPALTALPDLTFPARKDSRYGVSLAHPAYLECWEAGLAWLGESGPEDLPAWLGALYRAPSRAGTTYDAYLHDAGLPPRDTTTRADLSWWMLLAMAPALDPPADPWRPSSTLLANQGLVIQRRGDRYVSLECGATGGGHGHPDRLHLTVHAGGVHWLPDPGTGSYVTPDLHWYRSTLAHNAPRLNGESQPIEAARCAAFAEQGDWAWARGEFQDLRRTVVTGPDWLVDWVELEEARADRLELPWHFQGEITVVTAGRWVDESLPDEFVTGSQRFEAESDGPIQVRVTRPDGAVLGGFFAGGGLIRAEGPGLPTTAGRATFLLARAGGPPAWLGAVLDFGGGITAAAIEPGRAAITTAAGVTRIEANRDGATVHGPGGRATLGGLRPRPAASRPLLRQQPVRVEGQAIRVDAPPALDGSLAGFDLSAPLELADELNYNRSEEPYPGPDALGAAAYVNWDERTLYLAVEVSKPEVVIRPPDAPPLELDNEPDDIHADGVQVYVKLPGGEERALLARPTASGGIVARPIPGGGDGPIEIDGGSIVDEHGYRLTIAVPCPGLDQLPRGQPIEFDLIVNEMRPGRVRRAGQLVWSGGGGWVYLRGDRHDSGRFGLLDLVS